MRVCGLQTCLAKKLGTGRAGQGAEKAEKKPSPLPMQKRFGENLSWPNLTPELRRTALRRRVWFDSENLTRRREAVSA